MFKLPQFVPSLSLAGAILLATSSQAAIRYSVTELKPLPGFTRGAVGDESYGINNAGQTAGRMLSGPDGDRAAVWDRAGAATQLATPDGAWFSKADGVNNHGVVSGDIGVGAAGDFNNRRAVQWTTPDTYQYLLPDVGRFSTGDMINDNGWIGGLQFLGPYDDNTWQAYVRSPDGAVRWVNPTFDDGRVEWTGVNNTNVFAGTQSAFDDQDGHSYDAVVWTDAGGVVVLPGLSHDYQSAADINDSGIVVGEEYDGDVTDTGLWWDAAHNVHILGFVPGTTSEIATGLNNLGLVVGWSADTANCDGFGDSLCRRASIWTLGGQAKDLNGLIDPSLGYTLLFANGVNDSGDIYGEAVNKDGQRFLFLAQSVPEPGTWTMMLGGLALVGGMLRRRAKPALA